MTSTSSYHPDAGTLIRHIGIIPDGGRRWAQASNCSLEASYSRTGRVIEEMVRLFSSEGIFETSIYLSSIQNFRRPSAEIDSYLRVMEDSMRNQIPGLAMELGLKITVTGNREVLPSKLKSAVLAAVDLTSECSKGRLNLLLAYDPLMEIIEAFNRSGTPELFYKHLAVSNPVDLIIRTGGANVMSGFLPLQSGFARLYFTDTLFNDFLAANLAEILGLFRNTIRKFGE